MWLAEKWKVRKCMQHGSNHSAKTKIVGKATIARQQFVQCWPKDFEWVGSGNSIPGRHSTDIILKETLKAYRIHWNHKSRIGTFAVKIH